MGSKERAADATGYPLRAPTVLRPAPRQKTRSENILCRPGPFPLARSSALRAIPMRLSDRDQRAGRIVVAIIVVVRIARLSGRFVGLCAVRIDQTAQLRLT